MRTDSRPPIAGPRHTARLLFFHRTMACVLGGIVLVSGCGKRAPEPGRGKPPSTAEKPKKQPPSAVPDRLSIALAEFNRGAALMEQSITFGVAIEIGMNKQTPVQ